MASLYFYFNATTGDLVYSNKTTYSGSGYTSLGPQNTVNPDSESDWIFHSQRANIKTVTKDPNISSQIDLLTRMKNMFSNCTSLTSLDLSGFNTSKVRSMNSMFSDCSALTSLDLSNFDTSYVTNMNNMFSSCTSLTSLDLSSFDTSIVWNMAEMFSDCSALTSLDLSGFNTSKVTHMYNMFFRCYALTSLDLSSFDTSKATSVVSVFYNCRELRTIDISPNMSNILPELPAATYYDAATKQSYAKANIPGGSTYVRDLADLDLVSTMIQNRQAVRSVRHMVNGLSKRVVALETFVSSLA